MIRVIIKCILPDEVQRALLRVRNCVVRKATQWIVPWAAAHRTTSQLYYTLFSRAFAREQHAVLYGRAKYAESTKNQENADEFALLRRNTHRIEKGLLMRPRRDVFALDYIEETVEAYARRTRAAKYENGYTDMGELAWARDVLDTYFRITNDHPVINQACEVFQKTEKETTIYAPRADRGTSGQRAPYLRDSDCTPVSYEALQALAIKRRSVRWFTDEPVARELIDKAISVALQAPSACNRQPFEFRIYDDPALVQKIAGLPGGTKGYAHNIPVIVILMGRLRAYFSERDRHVIYIDASLAAMSFMLALETLGLSSCPINWPDVEHREQAMEEILGLEPDERPVMLLAIGYPSEEGMVAYSQKKDLSRIRSYNKQ